METNKRGKLIIISVIIFLIITVLITVGIILIIKNKQGNASNEQPEISTNNNQSTDTQNNGSFSLEQLDADNEGIFITNYVDTVNGFYFEYPVFVDMKTYERNYYNRETNVEVSRTDSSVGLTSVLGSQSNLQLNIFEEQISIERAVAYFSEYTSDDIKQAKQITRFTNNNIEWEKYNVTFTDGDTYLLYMFTKGEKIFVLSFGALNGESVKKSNLSGMTDELWTNIVAGKEQIAEYIVKSFTFCNDLEYMLNLKEASVLYNNNTNEIEFVIVYDLNQGTSIDFNMWIPDIGTGLSGISYVKTDKINIENIMENLTTNDYKASKFNTKDNTYTIKHEGETMTIKNSAEVEYKVKYYEIENVSKDAKYSKYTNTIYAYAFEIDGYVGVVTSNSKNNKYALDFAIKNISTRDITDGFWEIYKFTN